MSTPNLAHQESTQTLIPPRPSASHSIHKPVPKLPPKRLKARIPQLGWWWESGAVFISFVCMSLIVAILLTMDGKPMRKWTLPIQPNSLIAVFSTITKSALLVAIAESIGQLKWGYFDRARNIRHMQNFDEASRGPWGAFAFLWRTRGTSVLAAFGSAITVLMLGFEPFTQQIIELHTQEAVLLNTTGFVASTNSFTSSALTGNKTFNVLGFSQELFVPMVIGLLGSILGPSNPMPNNAYCPTLRCSVEDFTSLAICDFCEIEEINLGKDSEHCYYEIQKGFPKNASLPVWEGRVMTALLPNETISGPLSLHADFKAAVAKAEEGSVWVRQCTINRDNTDGFQLNLQVTPQYVRDTRPAGEVVVARNENETSFILAEPSPNGTWYRTMQLKYGPHSQSKAIGVDYLSWTTPGSTPSTAERPTDIVSACALVAMNSTNEDYTHSMGSMSAPSCFTTTSDLLGIEQLDNFGEIKGTMTRCHPGLCARRYENVSVGSSGNKRVTKTTDTHLKLTNVTLERQEWWREQPSGHESHEPETPWEAVSKDGSNNTFYYESLAPMLLWGQFAATIEAKNFQALLAQNLPRGRDDWAQLWARLSDVLSEVIQSPINPNATRIYGDAYGPEIFLRVRWEWFIMPLFLVVASNVFLCLTIFHSRKHPYLFKNSVMAILFHGLEGWEAHDLIPAKRPGKETFHDIMDTAGRMRASLRRNSDGVLKLKKE